MDENQTMDHDRIMKINIEEEMKSSYIDYSMSVIVAFIISTVSLMCAMVSSLCIAVFFTVCSVLETPVTNLIRNVRAW